MRIVVAAMAAFLLSITLLQDSGTGRGAVQAAQASAKVAVVPGFAPPTYPGYYGIPALPITDPQLSHYQFTKLPAAEVTTTNLQQFDTVVLYGLRWSSLSATARQAINTFAATGKVVIWDADDTGPQSYSTFIHPFSTVSSGENFKGKPNDSVVSFPGGDNFLASASPSSPYYLDPNQLVTNRDEINDMDAMPTGTSGWTPALVAANKSIPQGGWVVAWSYGAVAAHTGLEIYSGIDADAFSDKLSPNNAIKELALELAAPFLRTPASCAPGCKPPPSSGGKTYASCTFQRHVPRGWVHGRVPIVLKTSVAAGITGRVSTASGKILASARESKTGLLRFRVKTKRLRSNHANRLQAAVYVNGQRACSKSFRLRVDNVRPKVLMLATSRSGGRDLVSLRVSEKSRAAIYGRGVTRRRQLSAHRLFTIGVPARVGSARLILSDRAGNRMTRVLRWH